MITIQYLEPSPGIIDLDEKAVVRRLRAAYDRLPFSHLLLGWEAPPNLLEACRKETERLGIRLLRWHPLLAANDAIGSASDCQVVGPSGQKIGDFTHQPAFTFVCPNHPHVQDALASQFEDLLRLNVYQGFFLDRIRFPSPSADPIAHLGCFCEHCQRKALNQGLDLEPIRMTLLQRINTTDGYITLVQALLAGLGGYAGDQLAEILIPFLEFRKRSVRDLLASLLPIARSSHVEIGLDCFSPSLTAMVGQDLSSLGELADWVKLMTYAHTLGPAGLPYELLALFDFLTVATSLPPADVLNILGTAIGIPLPPSRAALLTDGILSLALAAEIRRGVSACSSPVLAGIELVDLPGITSLHPQQIRSDLQAVRVAQPAGLAISWDLQHIPLERLDLVKQLYFAS